MGIIPNTIRNETIRLVLLLLLLPQAATLCGLRFAKPLTAAPRRPLLAT